MNLSSPARSIPWTGHRVADTILREMEAHRKRLGAQLLALRKARGWNQEDAAHEVGVGVKTWRLWERGKAMPYDSNIRRLAEVFEIDPDELGQQKPAPLGLTTDQAPAGDSIADRLDAIEQALADLRQERADEATAVRALLAKQDDLLARQSRILERIESAMVRDTGVRDEIADLIAHRGREIVEGRPAGKPDPQPAPARSGAARKSQAAKQRIR